MKKYQYDVVYVNGHEETFYCNGFTEAIVSAMYYAINKAWDIRIKYITEEHKTTIENIKFPQYTFSK